MLLICGLFLLGQASLKWGANYYFQERARLPLRVGRLFINPATSQITLGLKGSEPGQMLLLDLGRVRFDWWTMFLRRLRLGNVSLSDIELSIRRDAQGHTFVGDINIPTGETQAPAKPASSEGHHWGVGVGDVDLNNLRVNYRDPQMKLNVTVVHFHMDPAESWYPNRSSHFDGVFLINGGRLAVSGSARPFAHPLGVDSEVQLFDLPLGWIAPVLAASGISDLQGAVSMNTTLAARYTPDTAAWTALVNGTVHLSSVAVAGPVLGTSRVGLDGTMTFEDWLVGGSSVSPVTVHANAWTLGPGAQLRLSDPTLHPPFRYRISPLSLHLEPIDTSDPAAVTQFKLLARMGEFEKVDVHGRLAPLARVPDGRLEIAVDGLNLTPFTSYSQHAAGYRVTSGLLDLQTHADIPQGQLKAEISFTANKFYLEKLKSDELDEADKQIGLPLNLCLSLLRDADDNIRMKVPVEGNLNDPKVRVWSLVWQVLGKALAAALRNSAMSFFPSGSHLGFDPVVFAPGSSQLSPEAQTYLQNVGQKLIQRPQVAIKLAGKAVGNDWLGLQKHKITPDTKPVDVGTLKPEQTDQLLTLAGARAEALRSYLVDTVHVDVKRLLVSPPSLDAAPTASPRAELSL